MIGGRWVDRYPKASVICRGIRRDMGMAPELGDGKLAAEQIRAWAVHLKWGGI